MTDISPALERNPVTGRFQSLYQEMNPAYQLGEGRYSPAQYGMDIVYPRPDSNTSQYAYHRIWQTGEPMDIPIRAMWGSFPHCYRILSAPDGWTIGEWLVTDGNGDLVVNDAYGTLSNPSVSAGTHTISVGIWDMSGGFKNARFTITVGNYGFFAAPSALGSGDGSTAANAMALIDAQVAADGLSPAKNKILFLRGGDYTWSGDFVISTNKALAVVNYRSEVPNLISGTTGQQFRLKASDAFVKGLKLTDWGDAAVFRTDSTYYERQSVWRCEIVDAFGDPMAANNEAGWFIDRASGVKRPHFLFSEITYTNCHEVAALDWYEVNGIIERQVWNTNKTTIEEPLWYPKAGNAVDMRLLKFDNQTPTVDASVNGLIDVGNNEQYTTATVQVRFCLIKSISSSIAVGFNTSINAHSINNWVDHVTVIGGQFQAKNYDADDNVNVDSCVIVNSVAGVSMPQGGGATVTNLRAATSGLVDSNGRLLVTADVGLYGNNIRA